MALIHHTNGCRQMQRKAYDGQCDDLRHKAEMAKLSGLPRPSLPKGYEYVRPDGPGVVRLLGGKPGTIEDVGLITCRNCLAKLRLEWL